MTENHPTPGSEERPSGPVSSERGLVNIVYILYLASLVFGITGVIGVIMAFINEGDSPKWLWSHYDFQIRTFWMGLLYLAIAAVTTPIVIGWLLIPLWYIWLIIRCARGMKYVARGERYPNPKSWWFG